MVFINLKNRRIQLPKKNTETKPDEPLFGEGHNSETGGVSGERLKAFMERVERLQEEKSALSEDIRDIFAEAKAVGFDTKIMRKVIRLRAMDKEKRDEEQALIELYGTAVGVFS
jgi:uncharacterized protein (UPF0335 family)